MHVETIELPPEAFPVRMEALSMATGAKVWETIVTSPEDGGFLAQMVSLIQQHGPLRIRVTYGYGRSRES